MTRISPPYSLPVHLPCLSSFLGPSLSLIMSKQVTSCNVACWYVDFKNVTSPSFKMSCICMSTTLLGLEVPSALLSANLALGTPTVLELLLQPRGSFKLTLRTLFLQESGPKTAAHWDVCCASSTPVVVDSLRKSSEIGFAWGGEQQICYRMPAARVLVSKESNTSSKGRLSGGQLWKSDLKPTLWTGGILEKVPLPHIATALRGYSLIRLSRAPWKSLFPAGMRPCKFTTCVTTSHVKFTQLDKRSSTALVRCCLELLELLCCDVCTWRLIPNGAPRPGAKLRCFTECWRCYWSIATLETHPVWPGERSSSDTKASAANACSWLRFWIKDQ